MKHKLLASVLIASLWPGGVAFAQEAPSGADLSPWVILSTFVYGVLGIVLLLAGYLVFDRLVGLDLKRELVEDQNTALGIMLAGVFIGTAIVIAGVMLS